MDGRGDIRGWAGGDGVNRTIGGAIFADHTELVDSEGDWLVDLQRKIGCHRLKAHVDPEFGDRTRPFRANSPTPASMAMGTMSISGFQPRVSR